MTDLCLKLPARKAEHRYTKLPGSLLEGTDKIPRFPGVSMEGVSLKPDLDFHRNEYNLRIYTSIMYSRLLQV